MWSIPYEIDSMLTNMGIANIINLPFSITVFITLHSGWLQYYKCHFMKRLELTRSATIHLKRCSFGKMMDSIEIEKFFLRYMKLQKVWYVHWYKNSIKHIAHIFAFSWINLAIQFKCNCLHNQWSQKCQNHFEVEIFYMTTNHGLFD